MRRDDGQYQTPLPQGYEELGKEVLAINWLNTQLGSLKRCTPCERRTSLEACLTDLLNVSAPFVPYSKLKSELQNAQKQIEKLTKELETTDSPPMITDFIDDDSVVEPTSFAAPLENQKHRFLFGFVAGVVLCLIVLLSNGFLQT